MDTLIGRVQSSNVCTMYINCASVAVAFMVQLKKNEIH